MHLHLINEDETKVLAVLETCCGCASGRYFETDETGLRLGESCSLRWPHFSQQRQGAFRRLSHLTLDIEIRGPRPKQGGCAILATATAVLLHVMISATAVTHFLDTSRITYLMHNSNTSDTRLAALLLVLCKVYFSQEKTQNPTSELRSWSYKRHQWWYQLQLEDKLLTRSLITFYWWYRVASDFLYKPFFFQSLHSRKISQPRFFTLSELLPSHR